VALEPGLTVRTAEGEGGRKRERLWAGQRGD